MILRTTGRAAAVLTLTATVALSATACGSSKKSTATSPASSGSAAASGAAGGSGEKITMASANFDESKILAQVYGQALEHAGFKLSYKELTTRPVINQAMQSGEVDMTPEYVGSLTIYINNKVNGANAPKISSGDPQATVAKLRPLLARQSIDALDTSPASDENSYAVTKEFSQQNNITSLSDLGKYKGKLTIGGTPECRTYAGCLPGLKSVYGIDATLKIEKLQSPLLVQDLKKNKVQFAEYLSSDPTVATEGLVILKDDKQLQDADNILPVVRTSKDTPALKALVNKVSAALSLDDLINLNKEVSVDHKQPAAAAKDFLQSKGLLS